MEAAGYHGAYTFEGPHDPFLPLVLAADATERLELTTAVAIAFARNPMTLAVQAHDLQRLSGGRFHLGLGSQVQRPHRAPVLDAVDRARAPACGSWSWPCGPSGLVERPRAAAVRGRALHPHADDPVLRPGSLRVRPTAAVAGRRRARG